MSGGHYNYIYHQIQDINVVRVNEKNPKRKVFQELLQLVATAMHDIEWVDSADKSDGDENEAIDKCLWFLKENPSARIKAKLYDEIQDLLRQGREL